MTFGGLLMGIFTIQPLQSAAIRLALEGGFLDVIAAADGKVVSASEIAKATGYDELLIG